jgi:PAB1-binding protein PBP1
MPYSNQRRHNSSSIPQTPYQTLITPCPNFDPIYQVILLENSNEWNLSPAKRRIIEKREKKGRKRKERKKGAMIEKKKRWNLSWKAPCFEKRKEKEDEIYKLLGEILSKERKKGDHIFL